MQNLPNKWPFPPSGTLQERPEPLVEVRVAKKKPKRPKIDLSNVQPAPF